MEGGRLNTRKFTFAYDEHDHGHIRVLPFQLLVEIRQRFKRNVKPFVFELKSSRGEEVHGLVKVKRVCMKKMSHDKFVDLLLVLGMQILKLIKCFKPVYVQTIG